MFSFVVALIVTIVTYFYTNKNGQIDYELRYLISKSERTENQSDSNNDVRYINTAYDKQLIPYYKYDTVYGKIPSGQVSITDRGKLLKLLKQIESSGNHYQYIILDIIFEEGCYSNYDEALYEQIVSMPRIVIPKHDGINLADSRLYQKAGVADYKVNSIEGDFSKYKYMSGKEMSMALFMYNELNNRTIKKHGLLYTDGWWLVKNNVALIFKNRAPSSVRMLSEVVSDASFFNYDNKIIVIGDLTEEDRHNTYAGEMSGAEVNLNAYYNLLNKKHVVTWGMIISLLLIYTLVIFWILSNWCDFKKLTESNKWFLRLIGQLLKLLLKYWVPIIVLQYLTFVWFDRILDLFNVTWLYMVLTILSTVFVNPHYKINSKK